MTASALVYSTCEINVRLNVIVCTTFVGAVVAASALALVRLKPRAPPTPGAPPPRYGSENPAGAPAAISAACVIKPEPANAAAQRARIIFFMVKSEFKLE